jgi:ATP-dependent RNA helicase DeaD
MEEPRQDKSFQISEPENALPSVSIDGLPQTMQDAINRAGWGELTPVQARGIPYLQAKRDLMVQARTGSGKTGAFVLPILEQIDPSRQSCQALVLVPTRELAQQVTAEAQMLSGDSGARVVAVYGGSAYGPQLDAFKKGAHLVVGTPGRVLDHLIRRSLLLKDLKVLVFDEADRMLSMGFMPDMIRLQAFLPNREVNTYMFSATFPPQIIALGRRFMSTPDFLSLSRDHVYVEDTHHMYCMVPRMDKDRSLVRIIEKENPGQAIIFCNTKDRVYYVTRVLQRYGYNADQLSSDLSQNVRDKVLKRVRDGKVRFLVATDVAARGIDIPNLSHVIQYEPPDDLEAYIHRAGRTGRAGASGVAILLVNVLDERQVTRIGAHYKIEFEQYLLPAEEEVEALVKERLVGQLEARLRDRDKLQVERMERFFPLVTELAATENGVALLAMLLDDTYHDWMHHAPELPPVGTEKSPKKPGGKKDSSKRRPRSGKPRRDRR